MYYFWTTHWHYLKNSILNTLTELCMKRPALKPHTECFSAQTYIVKFINSLLLMFLSPNATQVSRTM